MTRDLCLTKRNFLARAFYYLVIFCFLCQFLLQSFSLPLETPREAIERLLHIDIATHILSINHREDHNSMMMHHHTHHHDKSCPLCPILNHFIFFHHFKNTIITFLKIPHKILFLMLPPSQGPPTFYYNYPKTRAPPQLEKYLSPLHIFQVGKSCLRFVHTISYAMRSVSL